VKGHFRINAGLAGQGDMAEMAWMTNDPDTLFFLTFQTFKSGAPAMLGVLQIGTSVSPCSPRMKAWVTNEIPDTVTSGSNHGIREAHEELD
jgi:hypothetical protein